MSHDGPGGEHRRDDAAWEQIVASLQGPDSEGNPRWPAEEDTSTTRPDDEPRRGQPDEPIIIWRGSEADIDTEISRAVPDEHFEPPEPPPLPRADAITWAAWLGVIGGPLALLLLTALGWSSAVLVVGATAAFVGGFALLVSRMRTQRDPDDPDDGAVV